MVTLHARRLAEQLATPFDTDTYLSLLNPLWGNRLRAEIVSIEPQTATAASIRLRPGRAWNGHRPGQFVTVGVDIDGVRHHRCYSLTSTPDDPLLEITVQATVDGFVSAHLVGRARPGDVVQLSQADGDFLLPETGGDPLLMVTGGSGITPAMAMLRALAERATGSDASQGGHDVVVVHHSVSAERTLFAEELRRLDHEHDWLEVELVHRRADGTHRLGASRLDELCPDWRDRRAYVSGPESMLDFATRHWTEAGRVELLHLERFAAPTATGPANSAGDGSTRTARFARAEVEACADGDTALLDVAESAGLAPPFGCRMGICHTCTTRLDHGCVRDLRDGRLRHAGDHVQLCVSAAADDVVVDL